MRNKLCTLGLIALTSAAQAQDDAPLSAIDWLSQPPVADLVVLPPEPGVTQTATQPDISVQPLDSPKPAVGLVPATVSGLPPSLWAGSDPADLARLIRDISVRRTPALQALLYTLLLSEAAPLPNDPEMSVLMARIDRLMRQGAIDAAFALAEQAAPTEDAQVFRRWFDASLLIGAEEQPCTVLRSAPRLAPDMAAQVFCTARTGDVAGGTMMLDGGRALDLIDPDIADALDRFLHPEAFEDAAALPVPPTPTPLLFRLYEAIGETLPTGRLPLPFAAADLRDLSGWKAQLEAAERLARAGALPSNKLLGLYTERRPAASGGVWDRAAAVQRLETALSTRSPDAVRKTLPAAWRAAQAAGVEIAFADLFHADLQKIAGLDAASQTLVLRIALLTGDYETAARVLPFSGDMPRFWVSLAQGTPDPADASNDKLRAIVAGFGPPAPLTAPLGETILRAMGRYDAGTRGNYQALTDALLTLRGVGLEDVARRAALQTLLLVRN